MMLMLAVLGVVVVKVTATPQCSYSPSDDSLKCEVTQLHSVKSVSRQSPGNNHRSQKIIHKIVQKIISSNHNKDF